MDHRQAFRVENLDCMPVSELTEYVARIEAAAAEHVVPDTYWQLAQYARQKALAMQARLAGNIQGAMRLERICDAIYDVLPAWAQW